MPRSATEVLDHFKKIEAMPNHIAKKTALFDMVHDSIVADVAEAKSLGASDAMLAPFTETVKHFEMHKAQIVAIDLL